MELDDFKNIKAGNIPEYKVETTNTSNTMETLISELKSQDEKERKTIRTFIIIFGMFVVIYSSSFALQQGEMKTGFSLIVLGFLLALAYFFWRFRWFSAVDYAAPTTVFLKDAEQRYKYMTTPDWLITVPLIALFVAGGGIVVGASFSRYFDSIVIPVFVYLGIMVLAVSVGFWAGYKNWVRYKGGMLDKIRKMKRDFGA